MNCLKKVAVAVVGSLCAFAASAQYSYTAGPVTFSLDVVDATNITLSMDGLLESGSNWEDAVTFANFSLKDVGTDQASVLNYSASNNGLELNANGCAGGDSGGLCFTFTPYLAMADSFVFNIQATNGTTFDIGDSAHLKVRFLGEDGRQTGGLLSEDIILTTPPIPEPSTYALMLAGLGVVGWMARRRRPV